MQISNEIRVLQVGTTAYDNTTSHTRTAKYGKISSHRVTDALSKFGYALNAVSQSRKYKPGRSEYTKHVMVYTNVNDGGDADKYRILVFNSHNGTCGLTFKFGLFRAVCANGLVVGNSVMEPMRIRHTVGNADKLETYITDFISRITVVLNSINKLKSVYMTTCDIINFAAEAAKLRGTRAVDLQRLTSPTRYADDVPTVWNVMNIVQECMVRGGAGYRPLRGEQSMARVSAELWDIAAKYAA